MGPLRSTRSLLFLVAPLLLLLQLAAVTVAAAVALPTPTVCDGGGKVGRSSSFVRVEEGTSLTPSHTMRKHNRSGT